MVYGYYNRVEAITSVVMLLQVMCRCCKSYILLVGIDNPTSDLKALDLYQVSVFGFDQLWVFRSSITQFWPLPDLKGNLFCLVLGGNSILLGKRFTC